MFRFLIAITTALAVYGKVYTENPKQQLEMWKQFKESFNKRYTTEEEDRTRFGHFLDNLKEADKRQAAERLAGGTATHGVTRFSDMSKAEFKAFLGASKPAGYVSTAEKAAKPYKKAASGLVDWTGIYTTPVKNQGQCGSCWAFSATEQIESDTMRTLNEEYILDPQQIVDCADHAYGCGGGWTEVAYGYVKSAGGLESEDDYPYVSGHTGRATECQEDSSKALVTVNKFYKIDEGKGTEDAMGDFMESTGPLSVCVDANTWSSYTGGIMRFCGQQVDHCVQAVGVDRSGSAPYWVVRNSWGYEWGEQGTIKLAYGDDTCAIASDATYTSVSLV